MRKAALDRCYLARFARRRHARLRHRFLVGSGLLVGRDLGQAKLAQPRRLHRVGQTRLFLVLEDFRRALLILVPQSLCGSARLSVALFHLAHFFAPLSGPAASGLGEDGPAARSSNLRAPSACAAPCDDGGPPRPFPAPVAPTVSRKSVGASFHGRCLRAASSFSAREAPS